MYDLKKITPQPCCRNRIWSVGRNSSPLFSFYISKWEINTQLNFVFILSLGFLYISLHAHFQRCKIWFSLLVLKPYIIMLHSLCNVLFFTQLFFRFFHIDVGACSSYICFTNTSWFICEWIWQKAFIYLFSWEGHLQTLQIFLLGTYDCDIITRDSQCGCASVSLVCAQNGTGWFVGYENHQFL